MKPWSLDQTGPPLSHIPAVPCPAWVFWPIVPFQSRALQFTEPAAARENGRPNGRKPQSFLFSFARESKVIFGPFQYKSDFFFFHSQSLCLAGSGRGVKIGALVLNTFAFLPRISFVCLPLPGRLLCLRIVDFSRMLLSSQRK